MGDASGALALSPRAYRWVDRVTKLLGVVLVAVGLEIGGRTLTGILLGVTGAAFALSTVFVERTTDSNAISTDER